MFDHWVPDNDNLQKHRRGSVRRFCPLLFEASPVVHYVWQIDPADEPPLLALEVLTSTLGSLGWAIDQAYAIATLTTEDPNASDTLRFGQLSRFRPAGKTTSTDGSLRVPTLGSARDLEQTYTLNCTASQNQQERRRKQWPKVFDRVLYTSIDRPISRPHALFRLIDENEDAFRYPHAKLIHLAGMVRHLAIKAMGADKGNPPPWIEDPAEWVNRVVRGKRDEAAGDQHKQFSYIPLPSIGHAHADAMIRNVMILAPFGMDRELNYLAERLDGLALNPEGNPGAGETDSAPSLSLPEIGIFSNSSSCCGRDRFRPKPLATGRTPEIHATAREVHRKLLSRHVERMGVSDARHP